ncbi:hypothetical protein LCGC14_2333070 [marine sediment metagenome]|uniref:DZANK-type domain-containing protein n=1 Tax=marine sediment metagenome TaxID=412755 RepID=A0A0F9ERY3_9ZZZZ
MTYLAILLMMLLAFAVVGWPLISSSRAARPQSGGSSPSDDLIDERDAAYRAIKELDFEYQLGNLSEADYRGLRERYRSEAAATLRRLDALAKGARAGEASPTSTVASVVEGSAASPKAGRPCPSCASPREDTDRYCWRCGAQLGRRCPSCAGSVEAEDRFCAVCGAPVEARE